ncbi:MAG TPA: hypothetical protein DCQ31_07060 [Bacteroidales bacterium]|nr:hypothetical protein [Bacteroidales bacterium]
MKNKFKIISFVLAFSFFAACSEEEVALFESYDSVKSELTNSVMFFQVPTGVNWFSQNYLGEELNAEFTMGVKMIGAPMDKDVNVVLGVSSTSAAKLDTHIKFPVATVVIPKGSLSATFKIQVLNSGFTPEEKKNLVLEIKSSDVNLATASVVVTIPMHEKTFCALPLGVNNLVGNWPGDDEGYGSTVSIAADGTKAAVSGLAEEFMADWWGEPVVKGGTFKMDVNLQDNTVTIPRQYIFTTTYKGVEYEYEVAGTGVWNNCGTSPTLELKYDIYYPGDEKGLAATYSPQYLPNPFLTAKIKLATGKKMMDNVVYKNTYPKVKR